MIKSYLFLGFLMTLFFLSTCHQEMTQENTSNMTFTGAKGEVKLITLNPGHFHAALVQKYRYDQVDSVVAIYAPGGPELTDYLARIKSYNQRPEAPTNWDSKTYTGPDFLEKMISDKAGNVVVISGNNAQKMNYIQSSVQAGLNVLADKPMVIKPADFTVLQTLFPLAQEKGVLLYDIMTERYEITTMMQRAFSQVPAVFGELEKGTPENPAITKESVHHFFKYVSGQPLIRPAWFFDVAQQGEGIVDVSTHLVDLVLWECFPEQAIDYTQDIKVLVGKRWPTEISPEQFQSVTGLADYPDYLRKDLVKDSILQAFSNGEITFTVHGVHAKVSVIWNYQAPQGAADTHYSIMRGTKANLVIRQGEAQQYQPVLYVEPISDAAAADLTTAFPEALKKLSEQYPGLSYQEAEKGWEILIPEEYKTGHEAHFGQVTQKYLQYLVEGKLPEWEIPNMLAKYYVTTRAYEMSR
ncbi:MAG: putative oxidoreductase C-terminal domain-containing protein [Saprospiraceae bacterium]